MLPELYAYVTTPCTSSARREGYLREAIAIEARYKRCGKAWQPHLENTRAAILRAAAECVRRDKAVILGSGALLDIPVEALAKDFSEVCLIDRVHPKRARRRIRALSNVRLLEADLGSTDIAPFPEEEGADFMVSANLLSQLPLLPVAALRRRGAPEAELQALGRRIVETHLARLKQSGATVCLVTDVVRQRLDREGRIVSEEDALYGVASLPVRQCWDWDIAPAPEKERHYSWRHRVAWAGL